MENYFILLELPFDPPENNESKIKDAIDKKQAQWSRDQTVITRKAKASEYLSDLGNIKEVMLDPAKRKKEAENAKKLKKDKLNNLEDKLKVYRVKNDILPEKVLARLVKEFGAYGYSEDEIKNMFSSGKKEEKKINPSEVIDASRAKNIQNYMKQLNMSGKTLYDFLGVPSNSSCETLRNTANSMINKIIQKGEKTGTDGARQSLCGLCAKIFEDETGKRKYDNYVNITKYPKVNETIDEAAADNQKRIAPRTSDMLKEIAFKEYHISVIEAASYISSYCEYKGYILAENTVICGLCGAENPAGTINCIKCGKPLIILCPSCGTKNNNSATSCAKCGFDLTKRDEAVELLRQANQKYAAKSLDEAESLLKKAKAYWPNHEGMAELEEKIQNDRKQIGSIIAEIDRDIQEKRLYGARTKINQAKAKGFSVDSSMEKKVISVISEVENGLIRMRSTSGDEAFMIAVRLTKLISDSDELNTEIKKFVPEEASGIQSRRVGDEITLLWKSSPSVGDISYVVVRKENTYANDPKDGVTIYTGKELTFTDSNPPKNKVFFYSIYALRAGVYSKAVRLEEAVAIVERVNKLKAVCGDERVTLSWDIESAVTQIYIAGYCSNEKPRNDDAYERIPCARLDGITIDNLRNGANYWFSVRAGQTLNGKIYFSEPVYISAMPQKPARPLKDFSVNSVGGVYQAKWMQSEWDVILFYAKEKPEYIVGNVYDLGELSDKYKKIDINLKNPTEADFILNFIGECYIIPGVINASSVVLSSPYYLSAVPTVKDATFDISPSATEMYVNFIWPQNIDHTVLVYRYDTYPSGVDDPSAGKIECSKRQYESNEGVMFSHITQGTYYVEIYTYVEISGHRVYSEPYRAIFVNEPPRDVRYTLKYKKKSLFNKKCTLTIEIEAEKKCVFPAFAIVSKFKGMPLKRGDGDVVCTVEDDTVIEGKCIYEFEVSPLREDTKLKMFFLDEQNYKSFIISCKAGSSI